MPVTSGVKLGDSAVRPDEVVAHSAADDEDAPCVVQLGKSNVSPDVD